MVKVGKIECGSAKSTPSCRIAAKRGRGLFVYDGGAQPVRHEQDDVVRRTAMRGATRRKHKKGGERRTALAHDPFHAVILSGFFKAARTQAQHS